MPLESILKKVKAFGKPYLLGKVAGITLGVVAGITFGDQIYDYIKEIPHYNFDMKTYFITGYIGQGIGGKCGIAYYLFNNKVYKLNN